MSHLQHIDFFYEKKCAFFADSSSIYNNDMFLQDYSAREWVKQGAPKEKLMIGMPTYGRSFTLVDDDKFDIGAPASGGGKAGKYTAEAGFMSYYEVQTLQYYCCL
jgi:chitinase